MRYAIALDDPANCWSEPAISLDFRVLRSRREILRVVSSRLERMRRDSLGSWRNDLVVRVPDRTPAFRRLWHGSSVFLEVPADPEYHPALLQRLASSSWQVRESAARLLVNYPGVETVAALRPLLSDPAVDTTAHIGPASDSGAIAPLLSRS